MIEDWSSGANPVEGLSLFDDSERVNEPGVKGDKTFLDESGEPRSAPDEVWRPFVIMWSPNWALNVVETGLSFSFGNSETSAGAV